MARNHRDDPDELSPEEQLVADPQNFFDGRGLAYQYMLDRVEMDGIQPEWDDKDVPFCSNSCEHYEDGQCHETGNQVYDADLCYPSVVSMAIELKRVLVHDNDRN